MEQARGQGYRPAGKGSWAAALACRQLWQPGAAATEAPHSLKLLPSQRQGIQGRELPCGWLHHCACLRQR